MRTTVADRASGRHEGLASPAIGECPSSRARGRGAFSGPALVFEIPVKGAAAGCQTGRVAYLTMRLFFTPLTPFTEAAMRPAWAFSSAVFTKPLNCTTPL